MLKGGGQFTQVGTLCTSAECPGGHFARGGGTIYTTTPVSMRIRSNLSVDVPNLDSMCIPD